MPLLCDIRRTAWYKRAGTELYLITFGERIAGGKPVNYKLSRPHRCTVLGDVCGTGRHILEMFWNLSSIMIHSCIMILVLCPLHVDAVALNLTLNYKPFSVPLIVLKPSKVIYIV